jgi:hypothetical protein
MIRGEIWDAGKYKEKNGDIIETQKKRFTTEGTEEI